MGPEYKTWWPVRKQGYRKMLIIHEKTDAEINVRPGANGLLTGQGKTLPEVVTGGQSILFSLIQAIIKNEYKLHRMSHSVPGHACCM